MAKASYQVLGKHLSIETRLNEGGTGIEDVHVVPYQITSGPATGTRRSVKVPHSEWSPDNVRAAIESDVNTAHDVASIKG